MLGGIEIGLSLSVGVLLGGLVCGWLRSMWPRFFGRIPGPTLWVFESIGLAGFVAVVGLNAGPDFVVGLRTSRVSLMVAGLLTVLIPHLVGVVARPLGVQDACRACCSASAPEPEPRRRRSPRSRKREESRADARIRRRLRGRQRPPRPLGHRHRRAAVTIRRMMNRSGTGASVVALVALGLALCPGATLHAQPKTDVVTLANGDRITGEVKQLDRGRLEFSTDDAGTLYLEWDKLVSVVATRIVEVVTSDGRRFLGSLGTAGMRSIAVVAPGGTVTLPMADVTIIRPIGGSFWGKLDGAIDAGFDYTRSSGVAQLNFNSDTVLPDASVQGTTHRLADRDRKG